MDYDLQGLTGVVYGCKKSKPMVFLQHLKMMQRSKIVCERGNIFSIKRIRKGLPFMSKMVLIKR